MNRELALTPSTIWHGEQISRRLPGRLGRVLFEDIDFRVSENQMIGVVGPSGSGKSALLELIGLLRRPDSGSITLHDRILDELDDDDWARCRAHEVGFVFQSPLLVEARTASWNVAIGSRFGQKEPDPDAVEEALDAVGIGHLANAVVASLSGGERQRVTFARALAKSPSLLVCDEPTASLDLATATRLLCAIRALQQTKRSAVVVATHDPNLAAMCDKVFDIQCGYR